MHVGGPLEQLVGEHAGAEDSDQAADDQANGESPVLLPEVLRLRPQTGEECFGGAAQPPAAARRSDSLTTPSTSPLTACLTTATMTDPTTGTVGWVRTA